MVSSFGEAPSISDVKERVSPRLSWRDAEESKEWPLTCRKAVIERECKNMAMSKEVSLKRFDGVGC